MRELAELEAKLAAARNAASAMESTTNKRLAEVCSFCYLKKKTTTTTKTTKYNILLLSRKENLYFF